MVAGKQSKKPNLPAQGHSLGVGQLDIIVSKKAMYLRTPDLAHDVSTVILFPPCL